MSLPEETFPAMIEFLGSSPYISGAPPGSMSDLSDGVVLFEVLSEISPEYFDATTIAHSLGENWALKSSNLRKLIRNLETYFHEGLGKDSPSFQEIDAGKIAKEADVEHIAKVCELVAAAAVTCENKGDFVQRIMTLSPDSQLGMKSVIEHSMGRLTEYDVSSSAVEEQSDEEEVEMDFGGGYGASSSQVADLEAALSEARRELAEQKSRESMLAEDQEAAQAKLQALVQDLQERLQQRQNELTTSEQKSKKLQTEVNDLHSKTMDMESQMSTMADELDVAQGKADQLVKAEATINSYRKKMERSDATASKAAELERQTTKYLEQIRSLEADAKQSQTLQIQVNELTTKLAVLEESQSDAGSAMKDTATKLAELQTQLQASEKAKKMFESELQEARAQQEAAAAAEEEAEAMASADLVKQMDELRKENEALQKQAADKSAVNSKELEEELAKKTKSIEQLTGDKERLEAYTKRTLAKFQEKYLVALQECKNKLKEKQDKIEALENRSTSEKTAQKREERLLSSTIYELGLAIMQNRLKER